MEKKVTVYLDSEPKEYVYVKNTTKIGDIKKFLEKYPDVKIQMYINKNNELKVFDTNKYDKNNLKFVWKDMNNPQIFLTSLTGIKNIDVNNVIQIFSNLDVQTILNTCKTDKYFAEICNKKSFEIWSMLLKRDYHVNANNYPGVKENPKEFYMKIFENKLTFAEQRYIIDDSKFKETLETIQKYNPMGAEFLSKHKVGRSPLPDVLLVPSQKAIESFSQKHNLTVDEFLNFPETKWIIPKYFLSYREEEDLTKPFKDVGEMYTSASKTIKIDMEGNNIVVTVDDITGNIIREIPTNTDIKVFEIDKILSSELRKFKKFYINSIPIFIRIQGDVRDYSVNVFTTTDRFISQIEGGVRKARTGDELDEYKIGTSSWGSLPPEYIHVLALLYETTANVLDEIKNNGGEIPQKYRY